MDEETIAHLTKFLAKVLAADDLAAARKIMAGEINEDELVGEANGGPATLPKAGKAYALDSLPPRLKRQVLASMEKNAQDRADRSGARIGHLIGRISHG
jgi:hypothetical protein